MVLKLKIKGVNSEQMDQRLAKYTCSLVGGVEVSDLLISGQVKLEFACKGVEPGIEWVPEDPKNLNIWEGGGYLPNWLDLLEIFWMKRNLPDWLALLGIFGWKGSGP